MKYTDALIQLSIATLIVLHSNMTLAASQPGMEKCYGIVKAGMNDCETAGSSCASSSRHDRQRDAYIFLPKGICERIVGGELTAK